MSYIRDIDMLASFYGRASYPAFRKVKNAIDEILLSTENIEIICPLGTGLVGSATNKALREKIEISFTPGTPEFIQAVAIRPVLPAIRTAGPITSLPIRAFCIYTPAAIMPRQKFAG